MRKEKLKFLVFSLMVFGLSIAFQGCARLDDVPFINETLEEYKFDEYEEDPEFPLPDGMYDVDMSMVTELTLQSQGEDESEATNIAAIYVGDVTTINQDSIIVYCHGQSLHMDVYWPRVKLLAHCGGKHRYGVLEMDYRGYGKSEGTPTEQGMIEDVKACLRWLQSQGANNNRVFIYGFSLGTAPSTFTAANFDEFKPRKLILEAPFASAQNLGQESTLINFNTKYITDISFANAEEIKKVNQPFCLLHGEEDDYLKISNGEIIYENYNGPYSEFHRIPGADHGGEMGIPPAMGFEEYLNTIHNFLSN